MLVYFSPAFLKLHEDFWSDRNSPFLDSQSRSLISRISWIMYGLTGAVILCAIRRASEGRLSKRLGVIHFTTEDYSGVAGGICQSMLQYVAKPELDEDEFLPCMQAHHDGCLRKLRRHTGETSPTKNTMSYVAATTAELYRHPSDNQPAPISISTSSSSLHSSTFDHPHAPVALSSSSNTSWYPCEDEHDHVATKSPLTAPLQYYSQPHASPGQHAGLADATGLPSLSHSPSEPQYWNSSSSSLSGAMQPEEQQLVTNNQPMFSPYSSGFNVGSNQYSFGSSSWGGGATGTSWGGPMA